MTPKYFIALILLAILVRHSAFAQSTCTSEVSYKWIGDEKDAKESTTFWVSLNESGADEGQVKDTIQKAINREKKKASEFCRSLHENLAGCISAKFSSVGSKLDTMTFKGRKTLEDAIQGDCKKQQGSCTEILASEIKCVTKAAESADSGTDAGKDKKDKGKKK